MYFTGTRPTRKMIPHTCERKTAALATDVAPSMPNTKYENAATPLTAAAFPSTQQAHGWGPAYTNRN